MPKKIKLMLDYACSPLWWHDSEQVGNIDPENLPLSSNIIARLNAFAEANDATLNWDDPANSRPLTETEIQKIDDEGFALAIQLQKELFPNYEVFYFSEKSRQLIPLAIATV